MYVRARGGGLPPLPGATSTEVVTPDNLERFFGNGLTYGDRGRSAWTAAS